MWMFAAKRAALSSDGRVMLRPGMVGKPADDLCPGIAGTTLWYTAKGALEYVCPDSPLPSRTRYALSNAWNTPPVIRQLQMQQLIHDALGLEHRRLQEQLRRKDQPAPTGTAGPFAGQLPDADFTHYHAEAAGPGVHLDLDPLDPDGISRVEHHMSPQGDRRITPSRRY
jgi:hypothetical protein